LGESFDEASIEGTPTVDAGAPDCAPPCGGLAQRVWALQASVADFPPWVVVAAAPTVVGALVQGCATVETLVVLGGGLLVVLMTPLPASAGDAAPTSRSPAAQARPTVLIASSHG
jgi:hypothetical protein